MMQLEHGENIVAAVSYSDMDSYAAGSAGMQDFPVFSAGGVSWRPAEGQQLLFLPCQGGFVCAGAQADASGLEPGELKLSCGRGYIHLRANGEVIINGTVFPAEERSGI